MKNEQLRDAARLDQSRRTVANFRRVECCPHLFARLFIERHDRSVFAARHADQQVSVDERMARVTPQRQRCVVGLRQVLRPDDASCRCVETDQVAHSTERIHSAAFHCGCASRPGGITDRVVAVVFVLPDFVPGLHVETEHALSALEIVSLRRLWSVVTGRLQVVRHVHPAIGDRWSGKPTTDLLPPEEIRPALGKLLDDACFGPVVVAIEAHPLRPVSRGNKTR